MAKRLGATLGDVFDAAQVEFTPGTYRVEGTTTTVVVPSTATRDDALARGYFNGFGTDVEAVLRGVRGLVPACPDGGHCDHPLGVGGCSGRQDSPRGGCAYWR